MQRRNSCSNQVATIQPTSVKMQRKRKSSTMFTINRIMPIEYSAVERKKLKEFEKKFLEQE